MHLFFQIVNVTNIFYHHKTYDAEESLARQFELIPQKKN